MIIVLALVAIILGMTSIISKKFYSFTNKNNLPILEGIVIAGLYELMLIIIIVNNIDSGYIYIAISIIIRNFNIVALTEKRKKINIIKFVLDIVTAVFVCFVLIMNANAPIQIYITGEGPGMMEILFSVGVGARVLLSIIEIINGMRIEVLKNKEKTCNNNIE